MKRFTYLTAILITVIVIIVSCDSKREPGKVYMPDMAYSRAYETYADRPDSIFTMDPSQRGHFIYYDNKPAAGTIKRGELFPYTLPNDSNGYKMSAQVLNPLPPLNHTDSLEASRLFNINCAICHGADAKADGPLATSGKIPAVANLTGAQYVAMADGTMFHSINYGKNNMGSYASQLDRKQRWMIIQYIRTLQPKAAEATASAAKVDSTGKKQ